MKIMKQQAIKFLSVISFLLFSAQASALMVDLNDFTAFPGSNVLISADGLSATFTEDAFYSPVSLEHSGYAMPSDSLSLTFDFSISVGLDNEDYFDFYLGDLTAPLFSTAGGSATGSIEVDVSSHAGALLPMVFALSFGWDDFGLDSVLTISNLEIIQSGAAVPEPGSLMLISLGLLGVFFNYKRK